MKAYAYGGYYYCQDCAKVLDDCIIADGGKIMETDFPHFAPCDECGYDVFGREAEDVPGERCICPHCGREFPAWYWCMSGRAGGLGTLRKRSLAAANFRRHKEACKKLRRRDGDRETVAEIKGEYCNEKT